MHQFEYKRQEIPDDKTHSETCTTQAPFVSNHMMSYLLD